MKLFVVLFCIALLLNGLEGKKKTKEEIAEEKAAKLEHKVNIEIKLIEQRMQMMNETIEGTWIMDDWVPTADTEELKALSDEGHKHPDDFLTIINDAVAKIDEVLSEQKQVEDDSKGAFESHRGERQDEADILAVIQEAINNADLSTKQPLQINELLKKLIKIHAEFNAYAAIVKNNEVSLVKRMFKNMESIQGGIYDLCKSARKIIYDHKRFSAKELEKIRAAAEKKIINPLQAGLDFKDKDLQLSKMRDANESAYRRSYDKVQKLLNEIIKSFNKGEKEEAAAEEEEE